MNKRKLIISLWSSVIFTSIASGLIASIAWFSTSNNIKVDVTGSVVEEYFHCGDGTVQNPFVITRPIHYYHLVEFYQRETTLPIESAPKFGRDYLYFQIGYDLDGDGDLEVFSYDDQGIYEGTFQNPAYSNVLNMAYYSGTNALLPIGTNEVPFIGSFDGKAAEGISVSNINICCAEDVLVGNTQVSRAASDVGIFGYVADADYASNATIIKNAIFDNVTIDLTDISSTVNPSTITGQQAVPHTSTHAGVAHVGYIAGHIHTYTNYVNANTPAAPIHDVYVSNATIKGGAGAHCDFGYIGLVDDLSGSATTSVAGEVSQLNTSGGGQGQGNEWGGSIDMLSLNKRIKYYLNLNTVKMAKGGSSEGNATDIQTGHTASTNRGYHRYYVDDYSSYSAYPGGNGASYYTGNPETSQIIYRFEGGGTVRDASSATGTTNEFYKIPETYIPLLCSDESNGYTVSSNNTGYIASDLTFGSNTVRTASYANSNINNSYTSSELEVLSNSTASYNANNYKRINNGNTHTSSALSSYDATIEPSSMSGYADAYSKICEVLSSSTYVQGLHFAGNVISSSNTATVPKAYIYGTLHSNYKVLKSSVNFNAKDNGSIKFFAGSYGTYSGTVDCDSFFSLHSVSRSGNTLTTGQIYYIYANTNDATKATYPHLYYDSNNSLITYTGGYTSSNVTKGDLEFDMNYLHNAPPVLKTVYYFEIPVNSGEFALGSVSSSKTKGAYLMYLDIGTNGEAQEPTINQESEIRDAPLFTQIDFQTDSFVINSCFNVAYVIPTGSTKETFSITISCGSVEVAGEDQSTTTYTCYEIVITNGSGNDFILNALLMDDDDDNNNAYTYMYAITYNGGTRTEYFTSNSFTGASGGSSMTPTYQQSGS